MIGKGNSRAKLRSLISAVELGPPARVVAEDSMRVGVPPPIVAVEYSVAAVSVSYTHLTLPTKRIV